MRQEPSIAVVTTPLFFRLGCQVQQLHKVRQWRNLDTLLKDLVGFPAILWRFVPDALAGGQFGDLLHDIADILFTNLIVVHQKLAKLGQIVVIDGILSQEGFFFIREATQMIVGGTTGTPKRGRGPTISVWINLWHRLDAVVGILLLLLRIGQHDQTIILLLHTIGSATGLAVGHFLGFSMDLAGRLGHELLFGIVQAQGFQIGFILLDALQSLELILRELVVLFRHGGWPTEGVYGSTPSQRGRSVHSVGRRENETMVNKNETMVGFFGWVAISLGMEFFSPHLFGCTSIVCTPIIFTIAL